MTIHASTRQRDSWRFVRTHLQLLLAVPIDRAAPYGAMTRSAGGTDKAGAWQQFSTPPTLAWLAVYLARLSGADVFLQLSAD